MITSKVVYFTMLACICSVSLLYQCTQPSYSQGKRLYEAHCQSCHMENGQGLAALYPPLAGADFLERYPERIPCIIRYGQQGPIVVNGVEFNQKMPGVSSLSAVEITNLINYLHHAWGNDLPDIKLPEVEKYLRECNGE